MRALITLVMLLGSLIVAFEAGATGGGAGGDAIKVPALPIPDSRKP